MTLKNKKRAPQVPGRSPIEREDDELKELLFRYSSLTRIEKERFVRLAKRRYRRIKIRRVIDALTRGIYIHDYPKGEK